MIAKVNAPPYASLNDTQKLVVNALRGKSKTPQQLQDELKRNYHPIQRALKDLESKNWVEVDALLSGGKANAWRLKQVPTDGIELIVNTGVDHESISYNRYLETLARQLNGGRRPKIERESEGYLRGIAALSYYAATEFVTENSVREVQLLEVRSAIQHYVMALEEAHSVASQILEDERFWHADKLANGVLRKTDRHLTPAQLVEYAKMILSALGDNAESADPVSEFDNEEEKDSAEDYA